MSVTSEPERSRRFSGWVVGAAVACFAVATVTVVLLARDRGSGAPARGSVAATQARRLAPFASVELSGGNVVTIRAGRPQSVVVRADRDLLGRVTTVVRSGRLVIGQRGSFSGRTPTDVEITIPSVSALLLTGSGSITAGDVQAPKLTVVVSGSGVVEAAGRATRLVVSLSGSGDAMVGEVVSRDATATLGGSGTIVLTATRSLKAWLSGSGSILYAGDPAQVTTSVPGSGTVVPIAE